jgi:exonuclease SbcC
LKLLEIKALGFGCLTGARLEIPSSRRFVVIWGPNESGKSTWVEAAYVLLAGLPGGQSAERRMVERYRPWHGSSWAVSGRIQLDDGQCLEVMQDLARRSGTVVDALSGQDLTADFLPSRSRSGMPDLAKVCGLDRDFFRHLAVVRQGSVLEIRVNSSGRRSTAGAQEAVRRFVEQSSAASGSSIGAVSAIRRIEEELDRLGDPSRTSNKPRYRARRAVEEARRQLEAAKRGHQAYLDDQRSLAALEAKERELGERIGVVSTAKCCLEARLAEEKLKEATELLADLEVEGSTAGSAASDRIGKIAEVRTRLEQALEALQRLRPIALAALEGLSSDERAKGGDVSVTPEEDLPNVEPRLLASLGDLKSIFSSMKERLEDLRLRILQERPPEPELGRATPEELHRIVARLDAVPPPVDEALEEALAAKEADLSKLESRRRIYSVFLIIGVLVILVGAGLVIANLFGGILAAVVGTALVGASLLNLSKTTAVRDDHYRLRVQYGYQLEQLKAHRAAADSALEEARRLGLPNDREELRDLLSRYQLFEMQERRLAREREEFSRRAAELEEKAAELAELARRAAKSWRREDIVIPESIPEIRDPALPLPPELEELERSAAALLEIGREISEKRALLQERSAVASYESARAAVRDAALQALAILQEEGHLIREKAVGEPQKLLEMLRSLQEKTAEKITENDKRKARLSALLGDETLDSMRERVESLRSEAEKAVATLDERQKNEVKALLYRWRKSPSSEEEAEAELRSLEKQLSSLREQLAAERAAFAQKYLSPESSYVPVAEAVAQLEAAESRREEIERKAMVYKLAKEFLERASRTFQRDFGPRLVQTTSALAAKVSEKRYQKVFLDLQGPLSVRVLRPPAEDQLSETVGAAAKPVDAADTSYGTAEQLYLLFRLALANAVARGESIPVILDEVTVHADSKRTEALLEIFAELGSDGDIEDAARLENISQVLLFTQESEVLEWAQAHPESVALVKLSSPNGA